MALIHARLMYTLLLFALRQRFTGYVSNVESAVSLLMRILYIAVLLVNAAMVGWLIDVLAESDTSALTTDELIHFISIGFCSFWVFIEFFPTYTHRSRLIPPVFPVRFVERWSINLVYDTVTATTIGLIVGFCLIDALSRTYNPIHLTNSLLLFANTIICTQIAKAFIESTHHKRFILLALWTALVSVIILLVSYQLPDGLSLAGGLSLSLLSLVALLAYTDRAVIEATNSYVSISNFSLFKRLSPVHNAFLNNSKSRNAFGLGLILKTGFLLFPGNPFMSASPIGNALLMLYVSPAILFTYVANNTWGFFPALWINSTLGKRSDIYRIFFQLIGLPIVLDLISTTIVVFYTDKADVHLLLFYVLSALALGINGFIFSQYKAFYVHNSLNFGQMKNNVNGWSILTTAIVIGITMLAIKTLITTILFGLGLVAGAWYLSRQFLASNTNDIHKLYEQLFINRE